MTFHLKELNVWIGIHSLLKLIFTRRHPLYFTLIASLRLMHRYGCHKLSHAQNI